MKRSPGVGPSTPATPSGRRRAGLSTGGGRGPRWWRDLSPRWRRGVQIGAGALAAVCALLVVTVAYAAFTLPDVNNIGQATGTIKILDVQGRPITEIGHNAQARHSVPIDQVAMVMRQAQVDAEDRGFYNEGAFNVKRIAKALFVDVIARRPEQGASTITQQLAKLAFFTNGGTQEAAKSPLRKLREALVANEIDQRYSKDEILDKYLNLVYYGEGAYGIEDAAQAYFGKKAADLDLQEASLLAGLPAAPSYYDPYQNPQGAFARQDYVLGQMVDAGDITQAQADAVDPLVGGSSPTPDQVARQQQIQQAITADLRHGHRAQTVGDAPHFAEYVRGQLQQRFADDPAVLDGDLTVTTTLNLDDQKLANQSVANGVKAIGHGANNGALLMLDSHTGDIVAFVGSAGYTDASIGGQYSIVTAERQPGSSFKPYVYTEAFSENKLRPDSILDDTAAESARLGGVKDFDHAFKGRVSATFALLDSRNVPAEQAMQIAGPQNVIDLAGALGLDASKLQPELCTAIGCSDVRMLDHAAGYAALSNGGRKVTPRSVLKVVDGQGNVLVDDTQRDVTGDQVVDKASVDTTTRILTGYARHWGLGFHRQTAGKSGTTDNFVDAWYMVYTPKFVVATWTGHTSGDSPAEVGMDQVFGTTGPGAHIAVPFVNGLKDSRYPPQNFQLSSGTPACAETGGSLQPSVTGCPSASPTPSPSSSSTTTSSTTTSSTAAPTAPPLLTLPILNQPTPAPTPAPAPTPTPTPTPTPSATPRNQVTATTTST